MRQFWTLTFLLLMGAVATGCIQQVAVDRGTYTIRDYKAGQLGIESVKTFPVVSDLDVNSEKVTTTLVSDSAKSVGELKEMVMIKFLDATKADVVIEARYMTQYSGAMATITMVARPASYRNIRQATQEDARLFGKLDELSSVTPGSPAKTSPSFLKKIGY
jgi:hypothetical protein